MLRLKALKSFHLGICSWAGLVFKHRYSLKIDYFYFLLCGACCVCSHLGRSECYHMVCPKLIFFFNAFSGRLAVGALLLYVF